MRADDTMNQAAPRPRGRPRDERRTARRREDILRAATRLFAERGFAGTDVQVVADELGVGKGTIYRYFPSKRDLFLAAVDRGMQRLTEWVDQMAAAFEDPLEQIRAAMAAYLQFFVENADLVELIIQERAAFRDRETPTYFLHRERNVGRWENVIRQLIAAKRVRDVSAEVVSRVIGDLLYGTMFTNYFIRRPLLPAQQAADIIDIAFRGILTDKERGYARET